MAITSLRTREQGGRVGIKRENSLKIEYIATFNSAPASVDDVYSGAVSLGLPKPYSFLGLNNCYVLGVDIRQERPDKYTRWVLTVSADKLPPGTDPGNAATAIDDNALKRKAIFWIEHVTETRIVDKDKNDNAIVYSAGDEFDRPPTRDFEREVLVIQKNYEKWTDISNLNETFYKKLNNADLTIQGKTYQTKELRYLHTMCQAPSYEDGDVAQTVADETARLALSGLSVGDRVRQSDDDDYDYVLNTAGEESTQSNWDQVVKYQSYYVGQTRLLIDQSANPHQIELLSQGWRYKDGNDLVFAKDANGQLVTNPVKLDASGALLGAAANPHYMSYEIDTTASFTPLFADPPDHLPPP